MTLTDIGVSPEYQWIASVVAAIAVGLLAAFGRFRGKSEGAPKTTVTEFAVSPVALSDMKPVRDLVDAANRLIERMGAQIEADARSAVALEALAKAYSEQIEAQKDEDKILAEIERRWALIEAGRSTPRPRARSPRKPSRAKPLAT